MPHAETTIRVPPAAIIYVLLQRTELQRLNKVAKRYKRPYHPGFSWLEAALFGKAIARAYAQDMYREYVQLQPALPPQVSRILDIGCGVAGIDVWLYRHYGCRDDLQLYLLDKTEIETKIFYGLKERGAFYNSLAIAKQLLRENDIDERAIHLLSATPDNQVQTNQVDLVLSLISWGFHYPVSTYIRQVYDALKPGGTLILDVRKETGGEAELAQWFDVPTLVREAQKYHRLCYMKQSP
jgi:SAM-dependent methyltransferase